jgi:hypothetical protein
LSSADDGSRNWGSRINPELAATVGVVLVAAILVAAGAQ